MTENLRGSSGRSPLGCVINKLISITSEGSTEHYTLCLKKGPRHYRL